MRRLTAWGLALAIVGITASAPTAGGAEDDRVDHAYADFGALLRRHVVGDRVDYAALQADRRALDEVVDSFGRATPAEFGGWSPERQIAFLINAYNAFTLQAIIDHYPIDGGWLSFLRWAPRNSIKQIDGVWTQLQWKTAGRELTLDQIEHEILRVDYDEPRIHFAINCAAISCPPLRRDPYVAERLDRQLIIAARDFLASEHGVEVSGHRLSVSSIFNWFGDDFVEGYSQLVDGGGSERDRAVLGVVAKYGPREAARLAQSGDAQVRFLTYDWGLNDVERAQTGSRR